MSTDKSFKPWEWYPHLWKTEASFWSYLRGGLRRGLWEKSPIKLDFKNKNVSSPPEGYTGRAKTGSYCALTGEWVGKSASEVDHKEGNVSLLSEDDILDFIRHLVPPPDSLQLVGKEAHKIKSYAERQGISFKESKATKKAIEIEKEKRVEETLKGLGVTPASNAKLRRKQLVEAFMKEGEDK